jgi:hypothetical protein
LIAKDVAVSHEIVIEVAKMRGHSKKQRRCRCLTLAMRV